MRRSVDDGSSDTPSNSTCITPDGIVYTDAAGVRREVTHMTAETYHKVLDLYRKREMGSLNVTIV